MCELGYSMTLILPNFVKRMSDRQDDKDNQTAVEERRKDSESDVSWNRLKEDTEENNGNNPYSF